MEVAPLIRLGKNGDEIKGWPSARVKSRPLRARPLVSSGSAAEAGMDGSRLGENKDGEARREVCEKSPEPFPPEYSRSKFDCAGEAREEAEEAEEP